MKKLPHHNARELPLVQNGSPIFYFSGEKRVCKKDEESGCKQSSASSAEREREREFHPVFPAAARKKRPTASQQQPLSNKNNRALTGGDPFLLVSVCMQSRAADKLITDNPVGTLVSLSLQTRAFLCLLFIF